ncbi:MAG TPA: thiamine phosphate synthase [Clostridia bacterium]|nr:thiamine phosphate synthase [Clostridia bacterium]
MLNKKLIDYSLYLITDSQALGGKDLLDSIEAAIKGGVTLVQLREKNITAYDYYYLAEKVKKLTDKYNIPLIINDRVDIALAVNAAGVHLGPEDLPVAAARGVMGTDKIIGASANCIEEALYFKEQGADYLGIGALFPTKTKSDTEHVSLEQLKAIKAAVPMPMVGIGGISAENALLVKAAGVDGIAVASAILASENIYETAQYLRNIGDNRE